MSNLERVFYWRGIAPDYTNYKGDWTEVSVENRKSLLRAMGVDADSEEVLAQEAFDLDAKPWTQWLPSLVLAEEAHGYTIEINIHPDELDAEFQWVASGQSLHHGGFKPSELQETGDYVHCNVRYSRRKLNLPSIPYGYYELKLRTWEKTLIVKLAVIPASAYTPSWSNDNKKIWGFIVQLYTLRSARNWGIGDFSDLLELVGLSAKRGVDVIGLNPFHSLQSNLDHNFSPYSPSDRRYLNPLYIDVEASPHFRSRMVTASVQREIVRQNSAEKVSYTGSKDLKYPMLFLCFERFIGELENFKSDWEKFVGFVAQRGDSLIRFAEYEAKFRYWDGQMLDAGNNDESPFSLETFSESIAVLPDFKRLVIFHCYLQWIADSQLKACQDLADQTGMGIGLVRDMAVGVDGGGAEVESTEDLYCREASVGAPPDPIALQGQNWGLPPMNPAVLRASGFEHYITLLRENMSSCGALRIDHAMALMRLWWCPPGATADKGAYVYYPFREMFGLLCLESQLNKCTVICEDLGVVPDEFRQAMTEAKMFSNKVFYFEKHIDSNFKRPHEYDVHAFAMINNHDVPTLASWWDATDLRLRENLNMFGPDCTHVYQERTVEKERLLACLREYRVLPDSWTHKGPDANADQDLIFAIIEFVSTVNSKIFVVQLEDLILMDAPVNVPGTFKEHDNWQRKLTLDTNEIFKHAEVSALLKRISERRKNL